MSYTRPNPDAVNFAFTGAAYVRPAADNVDFSFEPDVFSGTGAAIVGPLVVSAVAAHGIAATAAVVLSAVLSVGLGEHDNGIVEAAAAINLPQLETSGVAAHGVVSAAASTLAPLESSGSAASGVSAAGSSALPALLSDGLAFRGVTATAAPTVGPLLSNGFAVYSPADYDARLDAPGPLAGARAAPMVFQDFTDVLGDGITRYVMDVLDANGISTRIPISSWQATLRSGTGSNYAQCVVPGVQGYVGVLQTAKTFAIYRTAEVPGGGVLEYEMVRAPLDQMTIDQGASRHTATLAGYFGAFANDAPGTPAMDRALKEVRSISISEGGTRIRCAVDWLLRPGRTATYGELSLVGTYINYYVNKFEQYMDVGSYQA